MHFVNQASNLSVNKPNSYFGILPTPKIPHYKGLLGNKSSVFSLFEKATLVSINFSCTPWIIYTEATDHTLCSTRFFSSITFTIHSSVKLPNGSLVSVTHI